VIVRQDAGGGEAPEALCPGYAPASWSADGRTLVFTTLGADGEDAHIMLANLTGAEARVASWRRTPRAEWHPTVSPNGRWLAYTSYESGDEEVYVESFPEPGVRQKVSTAMGTEPAWAPKGDAIFFLSSCAAAQAAEPVGVDLIGTSGPDRWCFFKVTFREGSPPALGRPVLLAEVPNIRRGSPNRFYDILPDGRRFLVTLLGPADPRGTRPRLNQIHIVLNWFEELKAKVPTAR
jgi:hypothetical protein